MDTNATRIKLIVSITHKGTGDRVVDFYKQKQLLYNFVCIGSGTASSEILEYLGLEETQKDVVITMAPAIKVSSALTELAETFQLQKAGNGIAFTLPLSAVSARVPQILCKPENLEGNEEIVLENSTQFELVLAIVAHGTADIAIEAAKSVGATGGTVLHARRVGFEEAESTFGFAIQPEKDILAILTNRDNRTAIMQKITELAGINTEARALVMSLPVEDVMGLK